LSDWRSLGNAGTYHNVIFAAYSGDWNAIHTDVEYAKTSDFKERIAHGMLCLAVGIPLIFRTNWNTVLPESLVAMVGMDKVRFVAPVRIGDTIYTEIKVADLTPLHGHRGLVGLKYCIKNQRKEIVITARLKFLAECRTQ
jgi:acyl dehydratase